jgi:protoporphyrin/coproporphyrin ferrochelatase
MTWQDQAPPPAHPPVRSGGVGVLLVNLGTPDAPDTPSVRRYLKEFLSDRRVVEIPALLWQPILRGIVLNTRPKKSAHAYAQVWTEDGSPLAAITRAQAEGLQARLGPGVLVDWAMRYGNPGIGGRLRALMDAGCERVLLAPLYPQYCAATTATAVDKAAETLRTMRWQPALRTLPPYHDEPAYIAALAKDIARQIDALDFVPEALLLSFHGMPERTLHLGDPYHCHCRKTARLLEQALARPALRPGQVARTRDGRDAGGRGTRGHAPPRRRDAGLFRRLPRNAGGNRHRGTRPVPWRGRRELRRAVLPQHQRTGHGDAGGHRQARISGLDLASRITYTVVGKE